MNAENALVSSEALTEIQQNITHFHTLFNNTDTGYLVMNEEFRILYFNEKAKYWTSYYNNIELTEGEEFISYLPQEIRARILQSLKQVLQGDRVSYEVPYSNAVGEKDWFIFRYMPVQEKDGRTTGICVYVADISERKKAELALKDSNELHTYVSKVTNDAIWDWKLVDNKLYWSEGYETSFGYQLGDAHENIETWESRIFPEDKERVANSLYQVTADPSVNYWEEEYRYIKADGSIAYVHDRGHVIYENGKAVRMVGVMENITNRKLYEIEREKITADIIQRNKDLEQFAFIVSHNLRSQIANILGLCDLLSSDLLATTTEKDEVFQSMFEASRKLDGVVKDLNYILQVKRNVNEKKEMVNLNDLVQEIIVNVQPQIKKEQAQINTYFEVDTVYCFKSYLYSIFHNLITNSIKYKKVAEAPIVNIYSYTTADTLILRFTDNGLGIDTSLHGKNIFGLYRRFHSHVEGKGMGLFMVKTQVETLDGTVQINSEPNRGTEFLLEFKKTSMESQT